MGPLQRDHFTFRVFDGWWLVVGGWLLVTIKAPVEVGLQYLVNERSVCVQWDKNLAASACHLRVYTYFEPVIR